MIETISFPEMVKFIFGALIIGFVAGMLFTGWLLEVYEKIKKNKKP